MRIAGGSSIVSSLLLVFCPAFGQSPTAPAFEVASIKPAAFPNDPFFQGFINAGTCNQPRMAISGNRVTFQFISVCGLIRTAYDVPDYRITGLPGSLTKRDKSTFYEIQAVSGSDGTLTEAQIRPMLQALLADRFQLKLHRETMDLPVNALVVGKNGPKLSTEPLPCATDPKLRAFAGLRGTGLAACKPTMSMAKLADQLSQAAGRPVIDKTGLTGDFAFSLIYSAEGATIEANSAPSIFTAIQEQLGLKLEPEKAPMEMLVIERAQPPSTN